MKMTFLLAALLTSSLVFASGEVDCNDNSSLSKYLSKPIVDSFKVRLVEPVTSNKKVFLEVTFVCAPGYHYGEPKPRIDSKHSVIQHHSCGEQKFVYPLNAGATEFAIPDLKFLTSTNKKDYGIEMKIVYEKVEGVYHNEERPLHLNYNDLKKELKDKKELNVRAYYSPSRDSHGVWIER